MTITWTAIAAIAVVAFLLFAAWYRKKLGGRPVPQALRVGQPLPAFEAMDENGQPLSSGDLQGHPAVILFVRGNWCPFCSRQVANLTRYYQEINERKARLVLVTPKPLETTRRVAQFFEFDFEFWLDEDLQIARQLGLLQTGGVPGDQLQEYGEDTVWPASLVVDNGGVIRYASVSKFIADRPDPKKFIQVLDSM